jgi:hypothetical protein
MYRRDCGVSKLQKGSNVIRGGTKRSGYQVRLNRQAGDLQKVSP